MRTATEFLGGSAADDGTWRFAMGRELHGAFGGVFGGAVAAAAVATARTAALARTPVALDCRFVRALPAGVARAVATVVHEGRTLSCVSVDILDERERIATRATVSLVDPAVLQAVDHPGASAAASAWVSYDDGAPWRQPPGVEVPIIATLAPRVVGRDEPGIATAVRVPWNGDDGGAEAACLAADLCVGPPVAAAFPDRWIPHPNPDLSLRLTGLAASSAVISSPVVGSPVVVGVGRLERIVGGLAAVSIQVWAAEVLTAVGVSSSLLLRA